ncbi:MAG: type II secretion system protein N [Oligoflexus sp.]
MSSLQEKLEAFWKTNAKQILFVGGIIGKSFLILFFAYMAASTLTAMTVGFFSDAALGTKAGRASEVERPELRKTLNYLEVRRSVVDRNLFNSDGEVPDESEPVDTDSAGSGNFDASAPCQKSSLPLELLGTIISGANGESLVTVREKGFNVADVYREGDTILGHEQASVFAVEPRRLILNNGGNKECIELKEAPSVASSAPSPSPAAAPANEPAPQGGGGSTTVTLEGSYVEDALGPGFAKILESGRLVPFNRDNNMVGFKLIGAKNDSLWQRVGLNSGDVITSVNGISMAQPEQGFAIFEALQNEREIRVEFLQKGTTPSNVTVEIK